MVNPVFFSWDVTGRARVEAAKGIPIRLPACLRKGNNTLTGGLGNTIDFYALNFNNMTIQEIAGQLVELCGQGQFEAAQKGLYAADAISTEPSEAMGLQSVRGLQAIVDKGAGFRSMIEAVHGMKASEAVIAGNYFSVSLILDVTLKGLGKTLVEEIAVYKVKDGKIVSEQFFY